MSELVVVIECRQYSCHMNSNSLANLKVINVSEIKSEIPQLQRMTMLSGETVKILMQACHFLVKQQTYLSLKSILLLS